MLSFLIVPNVSALPDLLAWTEINPTSRWKQISGFLMSAGSSKLGRVCVYSKIPWSICRRKIDSVDAGHWICSFFARCQRILNPALSKQDIICLLKSIQLMIYRYSVTNYKTCYDDKSLQSHKNFFFSACQLLQNKNPQHALLLNIPKNHRSTDTYLNLYWPPSQNCIKSIYTSIYCMQISLIWL